MFQKMMASQKTIKQYANEFVLITETIDAESRTVECLSEPEQIHALKKRLFGKTKEEMRDFMNEILEEEEWESMRIKDVIDFMELQLCRVSMLEQAKLHVDMENATASECHWVSRKNESSNWSNGILVKFLWTR